MPLYSTKRAQYNIIYSIKSPFIITEWEQYKVTLKKTFIIPSAAQHVEHCLPSERRPAVNRKAKRSTKHVLVVAIAVNQTRNGMEITHKDVA